MTRQKPAERVAGIAEDQWGLVTRRQAEAAGIPETTMDRLTSSGSLLERVAHGVYRLVGAPIPDHLDLRAAWLQLAPDTPAWERRAEEGVVSHRSAAALYGLGHLPADVHEFTVPARRRSRRADVHLHVRRLKDSEWVTLKGLPVTRPSRIASDLLDDHEEPDAVAQLVVDAIRQAYDYPGALARALAPHSVRFGLRRGDGLALLRWLLEMVDDHATKQWMEEAREDMASERGATNTRPMPPPGSGLRRS